MASRPRLGSRGADRDQATPPPHTASPPTGLVRQRGLRHSRAGPVTGAGDVPSDTHPCPQGPPSSGTRESSPAWDPPPSCRVTGRAGPGGEALSGGSGGGTETVSTPPGGVSPEGCLSILHPRVGPRHAWALRFGCARRWEGGKHQAICWTCRSAPPLAFYTLNQYLIWNKSHLHFDPNSGLIEP